MFRVTRSSADVQAVQCKAYTVGLLFSLNSRIELVAKTKAGETIGNGAVPVSPTYQLIASALIVRPRCTACPLEAPGSTRARSRFRSSTRPTLTSLYVLAVATPAQSGHKRSLQGYEEEAKRGDTYHDGEEGQVKHEVPYGNDVSTTVLTHPEQTLH